MSVNIKSASLGFSRLGPHLEYKSAIESFLSGAISENDMYLAGSSIRKYNLDLHKECGIDIIPSNDFSWHDHVLDTGIMLGNVPKRYYWEGGIVPIEIYFAAVFGHKKDKFEVPPMEVAPWFNTQYYYTVPEFQDFIDFIHSDNKVIQHYIEAKNHGFATRPVLLGPMTYILLGKIRNEDYDFDKFDCIDDILAVYQEVFANLRRINVKFIQIDEPCLCTDLSQAEHDYYMKVYGHINQFASGMDITLTTGFGKLGNNTELTFALPVNCVHVDLTQEPSVIFDYLRYSHNKKLSLGLVDGKNVFINDLESSVSIVRSVMEKTSADIIIAPSCSLIHCPVDLSLEKNITPEIKNFLAYGKQKLYEVDIIKRCILGDIEALKFATSQSKIYKELSLKSSSLRSIELSKYSRNTKHIKRDINQKLPIFPVTSLGGCPRQKMPKNSSKKKIQINDNSDDFIRESIFDAIKKQESLGFDIISHGEYERTNSLEYFTNFLDGCVIKNLTNNYVQIAGSEIHKQPVFYGDFAIGNIDGVFEYFKYARSVTKKQLKFTITGPITAMHRSFIAPCINRDLFLANISSIIGNFISRASLEKANIIQINEHNIREVMPLRQSEFSVQLSGLAKYIRNTYASLSNEIQLHLHICDSEISQYIEDLECLEVDVLLIDGSKSNFSALEELSGHKYQRNIGLGIHNPKSVYVPSTIEIQNLIKKMIRIFDIEKIWIVQDCSMHGCDWDSSWRAIGNIKLALESLRDKFSDV